MAYMYIYISQTIAKQDDNTKCLLLRLTSFTVDLRLPRLKNSIDESGDSEIKLHCLILPPGFIYNAALCLAFSDNFLGPQDCVRSGSQSSPNT